MVMGKKSGPMAGNFGIVPTSTVAQVVDRLRSAILNGELDVGQRLKEVDFAQAVGVSRPTIREATRILEQEGLVTHKPNYGATVRRLGRDETIDLIGFREVIELAALERLLVSPQRVAIEQQMALAIENMASASAAGDFAAVYVHDTSFHKALVSAIGNARIESHYETIRNELKVIINWTQSYPNGLDSVAADHETVLKAIQGTSIEQARAAIHHHLAEGLDMVLTALDRVDAGADRSK